MNEIRSDSLNNNLFEIIESQRHNPIKICVFHENFELVEELDNKKTITLTEYFGGLIRKRFPDIKSKNIIISLDNQYEFIISFFACTMTGNYPVPVASKSLLQKIDYVELIENVYNDSDAALIITTESGKKYLPEKLYSQIITIEDLKKNTQEIIPFRTNFKPEETFFIQYSSGSTRSPKGVVITHGNLMANLEQIKKGMTLDPNVDSTLSWLPLHHDMGLVGMVFSAFYNVGTTHVMGPIDFIKSPYRWLKLASDLKVSIINSPNSGYHTCINKITDDELKTLNLSYIRVAMSGAEPVNASVIDKFLKKFSICGLKKNIFFPVYGLAESTLAVTFPNLGEPIIVDRLSFNQLILNKITQIQDNENDTIEIVSCGNPLHLTEVKIVDSNNERLNDLRIGEILIRGPSVSDGYYQKNSNILKIKDQDGWCNTGDLGYIRNKNLFITGRKKDLIIINGKNISPHDLELKVTTIKSLRMGRIVIFSCMLPGESKEKVFVVAECSHLSQKRRNKIKVQAAEILGKFVPATVEQIYLIPPFHTRKTTSGKVKRFLMKELLLSGEIENYEKHFLKNYLQSKLFIMNFVIKNLSSKFLRKPH